MGLLTHICTEPGCSVIELDGILLRSSRGAIQGSPSKVCHPTALGESSAVTQIANPDDSPFYSSRLLMTWLGGCREVRGSMRAQGPRNLQRLSAPAFKRTTCPLKSRTTGTHLSIRALTSVAAKAVVMQVQKRPTIPIIIHLLPSILDKARDLDLDLQHDLVACLRSCEMPVVTVCEG